MAKKKKRKSLLPKRIAGVKVPKSVRKGRLGELLASQTGQALLAQAVLAAGAVGAAKKAGDAADSAAHPRRPGAVRSFAEGMAQHMAGSSGGGHDASAAGARLAIAFGEAARAFVSALSEHSEPSAQETEWSAKDDGSKKKPSSSPRAH